MVWRAKASDRSLQQMDGSKSESFFQKRQLEDAGRAHQRTYVEAEPFPHIVLDGFFPDRLLAEIAEAVPRIRPEDWIVRDSSHSLKRGCPDETVLGPETRAFLHHLNSGPFLTFLEALTGISGLIGDPHFRGGGLHQIDRGGFLNVHADFNYHEKLKLDRRLNLLIYLNRAWQESYGGHLELWDKQMEKCVRRILPVFNRTVIFSTTDESFHGHPTPLSCPPERCRQSIALYYYTNGRPEDERSAPHSTLYRERAGAEDRTARGLAMLRRWLGLVTPPLVIEAAKALKRAGSNRPRR